MIKSSLIQFNSRSGKYAVFNNYALSSYVIYWHWSVEGWEGIWLSYLKSFDAVCYKDIFPTDKTLVGGTCIETF